MKLDAIKIGIKLDMQEYYDSLMLLKRTVDAQVKVLEADPGICTHKDLTYISYHGSNGFAVCNECGKRMKDSK